MPCQGQGSPTKASSMPCQAQGQPHAMPRPRTGHGMLQAKALAWHAMLAGRGCVKACCWPRRWHSMLRAKAVAWHAMMLDMAMAGHAAGQGVGMACRWPRPWHEMPGCKPRRCGMACRWPRPWHAMLLTKAVACHAAGQGRGMAWHAASQGVGVACYWPRTNHHAAGRGCGMACRWPRPWRGMACCWPRLEAGAGHAAGRGCSTPCYLPRPWHGMLLAKAVVWRAAGQGHGMTCLPRLWHAILLAKAVAWHAASQGRGMTCMPRRMACCWPSLWHAMLLAKAVASHASHGFGMACCGPRPLHDMLAKAVAWHAGQGRRATTSTAGRHSTYPLLGYAVSMPQAKRWHVPSAHLGIGVACGLAMLANLKVGGLALAWHAAGLGLEMACCWLWLGCLGLGMAWQSACLGLAWHAAGFGLAAALIIRRALRAKACNGVREQARNTRTTVKRPRARSESTVRCLGKAPQGAVPSSSPGRHAATRSRRGSRSSSPPTADGFGTGTPVPSPQSQSFSRSYGSILLTSLAYIVPSTRGCSPWRPDAVMSMTGRGRHSVLWIFKGRRGTPDTAQCAVLFQPLDPTSG
ncbi:hypothetical protein TEA_002425 [Camellia sinensis var. sinensis]|uniref:Uncharacterized protein n=1 Tax=Camellia sinensis var. sinensis TaxID=542762 RepID=A0A4S4E9T2_CAMSN|nr:hypothetical protein TEA_002425 [Camellia sinensis var. sinensis]